MLVKFEQNRMIKNVQKFIYLFFFGGGKLVNHIRESVDAIFG